MNTTTNSRDFDDFVRRQQEPSDDVDWNKERDEWLGYLDRLHRNVRSLLGKYVSSGQIQISDRPIRLNEEGIGTYEAKQLILRIGRQEVDLVPVGTLFIGSKGWVEVVGPAGKADIMLVDSTRDSLRPRVLVTVGIGGKLPPPQSEPQTKIDWDWRIVTRPPERKFVEITQENLFQLIMEVANG